MFICFLPFFKGEPTWGPRYLTPVFALAWIFVPAAVAVHGRLFVNTVLGAGVVVQLLALSTDPQRLFFETPLPINYYNSHPWFGFHPAFSHLLQRPGEIIRTLSPRERAERYTTAPVPTHAGRFVTPLLVNLPSSVGLMSAPQGIGSPIAFMWDFQFGSGLRAQVMFRDAYLRNHIMSSFRPWWASQWYLPEDQRPVDMVRTLLLLLVLSVLGLGVMIGSVKAISCPVAEIDRPSHWQCAVAAPGP